MVRTQSVTTTAVFFQCFILEFSKVFENVIFSGICIYFQFWKSFRGTQTRDSNVSSRTISTRGRVENELILVQWIFENLSWIFEILIWIFENLEIQSSTASSIQESLSRCISNVSSTKFLMEIENEARKTDISSLNRTPPVHSSISQQIPLTAERYRKTGDALLPDQRKTWWCLPGVQCWFCGFIDD